MRRHSKRLKVKKLYLLGAGASYSATKVVKPDAHKVAPLDRDFCERIKNLTIKKPHWIEEAVAYVLNNWKDHRPFNNFGLEEAIIRQLGHIEFINTIQPIRKTNCAEKDYLKNISHLIAYVLSKTCESKSLAYKRLAKKIFPDRKTPEENNNRIITFNYDVLLDRHLIDRFGIEKLYFDGMKTMSNQGLISSRVHFENPLLIKLHGSINWRCKTDEFLKFFDEAPLKEPYWIESVWYEQKKYLAQKMMNHFV